MTFNSPIFLFVFLPLCVLGFAYFGRFGRRSAIGFLGFMSLVFYAEWNPVFLLLLGGSIVFNFTISRLIARHASNGPVAHGWCVFGIVANLLCLGYFKYWFPLLHFITDTGLTHHRFGSVILPLGISFFTFTQIAYLVDLRQGTAEAEPFVSYVLFVTFFPHLVAGPILHHDEMMPQFREERRYRLDATDVHLGLVWFGMGLFKKTVIADNVSPIADIVFQHPHSFGVWQSWMGALAYSMQLYFDFSGYSDMAVGLARIFSIRFPFNFNSPFKAQSIIDFWQRWHMTLTRYIMVYLFGPVVSWVVRKRLRAGKKVSKKAQARLGGFLSMLALPITFTMFIAGVWHGAGFTYIVFGLMHAVFLSVNHAWRLMMPEDHPLRRILTGPLAVGITFVCAMSAQTMFRADSVRDALGIYAGMAGRHGLGAGIPLVPLITFALLLAIVWLMPNTQEILGQEREGDETAWSLVPKRWWRPQLTWWAAAIYGAITAFGVSMLPLGYRPFIYFQF